MESLRSTYPEIQEPHEALVRAQQPWVSSQFHAGLQGGPTNAGLGLFFVSEMAKKTAGRFLFASRGGSLLLQGDTDYNQHHHIQAEHDGFPGTLVVFELPIGDVEDYQSLIEVIQNLAKERIPSRTRRRWIRFEPAPEGSLRLIVRIGAEDTAEAQRLVNTLLIPRLRSGQPIELDFSGVGLCTQSYLHALLFLVLREAYPRRIAIHITNASRAVASSLDFLESYALQP